MRLNKCFSSSSSIYGLTIILLSFLFFTRIGHGQSTSVTGYIIEIAKDKVYLDFNEKNSSLKKGNVLKVVKEGAYLSHPVTGEKILLKDELVSNLEIIEVNDAYSVAIAFPKNTINNLIPGMKVSSVTIDEGSKDSFRKAIAVQPIKAMGARGGYLGIYIGDLLTEQLFNSGTLKVIDRQTLGWQEDEIALSTNDVVEENTSLLAGKTAGVDYFITGTLYEPDVVEVETGIPVKGVLSAAELVTGQNLGSKYVSDVKITKLKAIVKLTLRVVDVETGEIKFICTEMQQAEGKSEIDLEKGVLGGLKLQGGSASFSNSITGKAAHQAMVNLSAYITDYFLGKIKEKNFQGNIVTTGKKTEFEKNSKDSNNQSILQVDLRVGDSVYYCPYSTDSELSEMTKYHKGKIVSINEKKYAISNSSRELITIKYEPDHNYYQHKIVPFNSHSAEYTRKLLYNGDILNMVIRAGDSIIYFNKLENRFIKTICVAFNANDLFLIDYKQSYVYIAIENIMEVNLYNQIVRQTGNKKGLIAQTKVNGLLFGDATSRIIELSERDKLVSYDIIYQYFDDNVAKSKIERIKAERIYNFENLVN